MAQNKHKGIEKKLETLARLFRNQEISDKSYDIVDTALRVYAGWITPEDVWKTFVDKTP